MSAAVRIGVCLISFTLILHFLLPFLNYIHFEALSSISIIVSTMPCNLSFYGSEHEYLFRENKQKKRTEQNLLAEKFMTSSKCAQNLAIYNTPTVPSSRAKHGFIWYYTKHWQFITDLTVLKWTVSVSSHGKCTPVHSRCRVSSYKATQWDI